MAATSAANGSSSLLEASAYETTSRSVIKMLNQLSELGAGMDVDFPSIVVCGELPPPRMGHLFVERAGGRGEMESVTVPTVLGERVRVTICVGRLF
jgi:hypothetical protein